MNASHEHNKAADVSSCIVWWRVKQSALSCWLFPLERIRTYLKAPFYVLKCYILLWCTRRFAEPFLETPRGQGVPTSRMAERLIVGICCRHFWRLYFFSLATRTPHWNYSLRKPSNLTAFIGISAWIANYSCVKILLHFFWNFDFSRMAGITY